MEEFFLEMVGLDLNNCCDSDIWLPNTSQEKYGSHWSTVFQNSRVCKFCSECRPALLEELTFSFILKDPALLKKAGAALAHIPQRLSYLIGYALNIRSMAEASQLVEFTSTYKTHLSWFCANDLSALPLLRFRFCCEVYQKLKPFMECSSKGIEDILEYLSDFNKTYADFWSTMNCAMKTLKLEVDNGVFKNVAVTPSAESNAVAVNIFQLRGGRRLVEGGEEFESMKELQRLSKTMKCPVLFQPTSIEHRLQSQDIPKLIGDIDPQLVSEVLLTNVGSWSTADVESLEGVLSVCENLSRIYLAQWIGHKDTPTDAADAISRLVGNCPQLSELGFSLMTLGSSLGKYPLPASIETLRLASCRMTEPGFERLHAQSGLALKHLEVIYSSPHYSYDGLYEFVQQQARSLEWLALDLHLLDASEYDELFELMVKSGRLQKLHLVCFLDIDFSFFENVVSSLMSIRSAKSFFVDFGSSAGMDEDDLKSGTVRLLKVMKSSCTLNRRPPLYLRLANLSQPTTPMMTFWRY